MLDNFSAAAPHMQPHQRPLSLNAAWLTLLACLLPLAGVAGWLLHAWVK